MGGAIPAKLSDAKYMLSFDPRGRVPALTIATTFFIQPGSNTEIEAPVPRSLQVCRM